MKRIPRRKHEPSHPAADMTSVPSRSVVVAAASKHGSTLEIADRVAERLSQILPASWCVTRIGLTDLSAFDGADAVILGSAIYYGHWMRPAARVLKHLREKQPERLWLFSTGPVSDTNTENDETIAADALADIAEGDEHMVFAGKLNSSSLSLPERLVVKAVHAVPGDHRDWDEVDAWADHIAAELRVQPPPAERAKDTGEQGTGL